MENGLFSAGDCIPGERNKLSSEQTNEKARKYSSADTCDAQQSRKIEGCNYTPEFQTGDAVLDPSMIQKRGEHLGHARQVCAIDSGLQDLILSSRKAREAAYDTIFSFIRKF